jgi:L-cysteine:1D-myo-inositol 2-amino-2-deoxy-alpha-D-glucopyranoside ligase
VLVDAEDRLARWRAAVDAPTGPPADAVVAEVRRRLADDLDAPSALAAVDRWAEEVRLRGGTAGSDDASAPAQVRAAVDTLLGVAL